LGWSLPGADTCEALGSHEGRLVAGTPGGPVDLHYRWVHPLSWRIGALWGGLPGFGRFCRAALSHVTTSNNELKEDLLRGLVQDKPSSAKASLETVVAKSLLHSKWPEEEVVSDYPQDNCQELQGFYANNFAQAVPICASE
jgi:hypothetical protein